MPFFLKAWALERLKPQHEQSLQSLGGSFSGRLHIHIVYIHLSMPLRIVTHQRNGLK